MLATRRSSTITTVGAWLVVVATSVPVAAAPPRVELARALGATDGAVVELAVDRDVYARMMRSGPLSVAAFPLPGEVPVTLELAPFALLAPGARFVVVDERGERDVAAPAIRAFRGHVAGEPDSFAVLTLIGGRLTGSVRMRGANYLVRPDRYDTARPGGGTTRVHLDDPGARAEPAPRCAGAAVTSGPDPRPDARAGGGLGGTLLEATVAIDATTEWHDHFGSVAAAQAAIVDAVAQVSAIYESEVLVRIMIGYLRVFSTADPYSGDGTSNTDSGLLLDEMKAEWDANQTGVSRTFAHLFGKYPSGGSGQAYIDTLCRSSFDASDSFDYGVSLISASGSVGERSLIAHEFGHTFASPHTHCYVPEIDFCATQADCFQGATVQTIGTIMSYCDVADPVFHPRVEDESIRPAAEAAVPTCIAVAGLPGRVDDAAGPGLLVAEPASCPVESLVADDGSLDSYFGYGGTTQMAWVKRFTPSCYPFVLERLDVLTGHSSVTPGRDVRLLVYGDPSGSGDPTAASLLGSEDVQIQISSAVTFNEFTLASPVLIDSGDVYLGVYDLVADAADTFIGAYDTSVVGDSWYQADSTDPNGFTNALGSGSWMMRGQGGPPPPGAVTLSWAPPCNDATTPLQDFAVYRGAIGSFDAYTAQTCTTSRARSWFEPAPPANSFWIVVPTTAAAEGSYGLDGGGAERPPAASPCRTQQLASCP